MHNEATRPVLRRLRYWAALIGIVSLTPAGLFAQPDSAATPAPDHATIDARIVIVLDSFDRATFANVAELLQARVPGLHIARTGDGGMRWFMRGPSSISESIPMVLVDDVRINVAGSGMRDIGTRAPLLDEIDIEDVERIEVWSGPATAIRYGSGAGNGVIRIVTFAPHAQKTSFRMATSVSTLDENVTYPANATRAGLDTAGRPILGCRLQLEATNQCTPTGPPILINVLEDESPFETAIGARVAAAVASGSERLAWRGGATFDRQGSTAGTLLSQRVHVRAAAALRPHPLADVAMRAHWMRGDADLPSPYEQSLVLQGLLARADTVWPGFVGPTGSPYNSMRYGVTVNGGWRPRAWLDAHLTSGIATMRDENDIEHAFTVPFGRFIEARGERRRRDLTVRLDAEARYRARGLRHATELTLERAVSRQEEEYSEVVEFDGGLPFTRAFWINMRTGIAGLGLTQRIDLGERATLAGGLRLDQVRVGDLRWDVPLAPHVSLSWDARRFLPRALGGLRLRAALGNAANVPQTTRIFFFLLPGDPGRPKAEVTRERELGLDATAAHDRIGLSITWYNKRTSNVANIVGPPFPGFQRIEVLNRGIETELRTRIVQTSRIAWDVRAVYTHNHNEVTNGAGQTLLSEPGVFTRQWVMRGEPLGVHRSQSLVSVRDLDGDGLIDDVCVELSTCEAIVTGVFEARPAYPPTSAGVETSFRFGPLTLSALLDHRSGHTMDNALLSQRCFFRCQELYDPSTSLREQAEAILAAGPQGLTLEDASFTKLREVSLRIEAPASWARAFGASRLQVSLAGRNLATWSDYSGLDPEVTSAPWVPLANVDQGATPLPRRFIVRADLHGR